MTGAASENDSTFAVRDTAEGSKNRTIAGAIESLFRSVAKAIIGRDEDEPQPETRRRRSGETEGDLRKPVVRSYLAAKPAARGRYAALRPTKVEAAVFAPADAYAGAGMCLADTLDWLNLWQDNAANDHWFADDFSAKQDRYFPQP